MAGVFSLPIQPTRTMLCLVAVIVIGSIFVHHADAQPAQDGVDCVDWLDAISEYEQFSWIGSSPEFAVPGEAPADSPPDGPVSSALADEDSPGISFPIPSDGYTILLPTNDAVEAFNENADYDGIVGNYEPEELNGEIISYHILVDNKFDPQFDLGDDKSRLERTAFMDLPVKIDKEEGDGPVAVSGDATGKITIPVDADGKEKLPENACLPVITDSGVVNVPVNIYAVDQVLGPFPIDKKCDNNILKCAESFYDEGYADITKPPYMFGEKVEWAA